MIISETIYAFIAGILIMILIMVFYMIVKTIIYKKKYTLPELQNIVNAAHKDLQSANNNLIKLTDAFNEIGKQNEN